MSSLNRRDVLRMTAASGVGGMFWVTQAARAQNTTELSDEIWLDKARSRELPTLVRWAAGGVQPQGVVLFSHGLGGKRTGADYWGNAWAQAGFVVVHMQHPGSDNQAIKGLQSISQASKPEQFIARLADVKFTLDELQRRVAAQEGQWAQLPAAAMSRLALAGHSFGSRTTLAIAGQIASAVDNRFKAFIGFSPAAGKGVSPDKARALFAGVKRPVLLVSGSLDGEVMNNGETPESRRMVYDALPAGNKALLWLEGADHFTFAGNSKRIPSTWLIRRDKVSLDGEERHHQIAAQMSTAWLKHVLLGAVLSAPSGLSTQDIWLKA
jgi:predicted dienelactone hydrolase